MDSMAGWKKWKKFHRPQVTKLGSVADSKKEFNPMTICWNIIGLNIECLITFLTSFSYKLISLKREEINRRIGPMASVLMNKRI